MSFLAALKYTIDIKNSARAGLMENLRSSLDFHPSKQGTIAAIVE
jgi:hypothetical protein